MRHKALLMKIYKKTLITSVLSLVLLGSAGFTVPMAIRNPSHALQAIQVPGTPTGNLQARTGARLSVVTLNVAHGRSEAAHQWLLDRAGLQNNLAKIGDFLRRTDADIVALQEADHRSIWSEDFDHVSYIAQQAGLGFKLHGLHVHGLSIRYGTALVSKQAPMHGYAHTFAASPPTLAKGFTLGTYPWPGDARRQIDVVSVHLDFSRATVRSQQIDELISVLQPRRRPFVIMGDFNLDWAQQRQLYARLQNQLGARAHRVGEAGLMTFPAYGTRLDWILISPELHVDRHEIYAQSLSDHYAVYAELSLREPSTHSHAPAVDIARPARAAPHAARTGAAP